jgi:uncharacterized membrane protein YedE/YeeE
MLITNDIAPIHWAVAGLGIAAITLLLLWLTNRSLGISSGFDDLCGLALPGPPFRGPAAAAGRRWRLPFLAGLVIGGVVSAVAGGGWSPTWDLGMFDTTLGWGPAGKVAWMFAGGVLIGVGTRMAGGCTSGHGIFGLSNFELPSLLTTISFMAGGIVTTQLVYRVLFA